MTYVLVLTLALLGVAAYVFRDKLKSLYGKISPLQAIPSENRQNPADSGAQTSVAPAQAPVGAQGPVTSDNPMLDAYRRSNSQYVEPGKGGAAAIDTSAAVLDFAQVGNGVAIALKPGQLSKTIMGCPDKTRVTLIQQSGAQGSPYTAVVNGQQGSRGGSFGSTEAELAFEIDGPQVDVSVSGDNPTLTLEVRKA